MKYKVVDLAEHTVRETDNPLILLPQVSELSTFDDDGKECQDERACELKEGYLSSAVGCYIDVHKITNSHRW